MAYNRMTALAAGLIAAAPMVAQAQDAPMVKVAFASPMVEVDAPPPPLDGVAGTFRAPPRDAAGAYLTPNRDLSDDETTWHVRVALNVAALSCRDADEKATVAAYNAMLSGEQAPLATASAGMQKGYQARFGARWQQVHDDAMTRLYNFFAQSPARAGFCAEAKAVLAEASAVEPGSFGAFAKAALPRLEAPFLDFYARFDAWRTQRADWDARHAPRVVIATSAPVALVAAAAK